MSYNRYVYALKFGELNDQIIAAREVLLSSYEGRRVRGYPQVRIDLVGLLLEAGRLGEAWIEYSEATRALSGEYRSTLVNTHGDKIRQIEGMISSDQAFARNIEIGERGFTFLPLVKLSFSFEEVSGSIETLKLRCKRKFSELVFSEKKLYSVPKQWGYCQLQIIGEQNSTAKLMQH